MAQKTFKNLTIKRKIVTGILYNYLKLPRFFPIVSEVLKTKRKEIMLQAYSLVKLSYFFENTPGNIKKV